MRLMRRDLLRISPGVLALLLTQKKAESQVKLRLGGEVLDSENKPIPSVLVTAYRRGKEKIGQSTTGTEGKYRIDYNKNSPIETVRYERTGYIPCVVEDLSGAREHTINKVMYVSGSKLSVFVAQASLSALERIYYIEVALKTGLGSIREVYGSMVKTMAVPAELIDRHAFVRKLYGV